jgi:hypothetical protein
VTNFRFILPSVYMVMVRVCTLISYMIRSGQSLHALRRLSVDVAVTHQNFQALRNALDLDDHGGILLQQTCWISIHGCTVHKNPHPCRHIYFIGPTTKSSYSTVALRGQGCTLSRKAGDVILCCVMCLVGV